MLTISVCIGSACHRRGSYELMEGLKLQAERRGLSDRVSIVPAFCLGQCADGISVRIGERLFLGLGRDGAENLFETAVVPALR